MKRKISLISIALISVLLCSSCALPDPTPAIDTLVVADSNITDIADSFRKVITDSDLSAEDKATVIAHITGKEKDVKEQLVLVVKYLSSIKNLDWKQYAALLIKDAKELKDLIDKIEAGQSKV